MALSSRELLLILRARDEASAVINQNAAAFNTLATSSSNMNANLIASGVALQGIGDALMGIGLEAIDFGFDSIMEAVDFEAANTLIATQAQDLRLSAAEVGHLIEDLARSRAVSIDALQGAAFDVFSTFEGDVNDAREILDASAILAVSGQEAVDTFAGALSGILNAFDLDASAALEIADDLFRFAEKGQITIGEFSAVIGRAIGPTLALGQSFQTAGAGVAFLTKETDLSASQASTSIARLMDMLRKNTAELEAAGITVLDTSGNFLEFDSIVSQLADTTQGMSDIELNNFLNAIFGDGEIRANRALIPLIKDFESFKEILDEANLSVLDAGGLLDAYDLQVGSTHTRIQELKNQWELLKIQIGEALLPVFERLLDAGQELLDWWAELSPEIQDQIIKWGAVAAVVAVVAGAILSAVGAILVAVGIFNMLGVSLGVVAAITGGAVAGVAALAGIAIALVTNWEEVRNFVLPLWDDLMDKWERFKAVFFGADPREVGGPTEIFTVKGLDVDWNEGFDGLTDAVELAGLRAREAWQGVQNVLDEILLYWEGFKFAFSGEGVTADGAFGFVELLGAKLAEVWPEVQDQMDTIAQAVEGFITVLLGGPSSAGMGGGPFGDREGGLLGLMERFARIIRDDVAPAVAEGIRLFGEFADYMIGEVGPQVVEVLETITTEFQALRDEIAPTLEQLLTVVGFFVAGLIIIFSVLAPYFEVQLTLIKHAFEWAFGQMIINITTAITIISNILQFWMNIIQGDWDAAWENMKAVFGAAVDWFVQTAQHGWDTFGSLLQNLLANVIALLTAMAMFIIRTAINMMMSFARSVTDGVNSVLRVLRRLPGQILGIFAGAGSWLSSAGKNVMNGFINGISSKIGSLKSKLREVTNLIPSFKGPPEKDAKLLFNSGTLIMGGLEEGLDAGWMDVQRYLQSISNPESFLPAGLNTEAPARQSGALDTQAIIEAIEANANGGFHIENATFGSDVDETVDAFDYWAQKRMAGGGV